MLSHVAASIGAAVLLYQAVLQFGLPHARAVFPSPVMAERLMQYRQCASGPAFSVGYREPSLVFQTETGIRMSEPEEALEALANDPGALVLIEDRWAAALAERIPHVVTRERFGYFNYNRGKTEGAALITPEDPRWEACAGP